MILNHKNAFVAMLANDALEATGSNHPTAALLLFDAALSILVTRLITAADRREMAAMFAGYLTEQVEAVIAAGGAS